METFDEFKKNKANPDSSNPGLQYPDFKKTGVGTFLYGIKAGLEKGAQSIGTGVNEYNKFFYDKTGLNNDYVSKDYEKYNKKLQEFDSNINKKIVEKLGVDGAQSFAAQAGMGIGQAGGQLALTAINPVVGYTAITAQAVGAGKQAYDEAYDGAKKNGMSDEQAKKIAKINGLITGAVNIAEVVPVGRALSLGKDIIEKPLEMGAKGLIKRFGTNALLESGTEGAQDFTSSLTAKLTYDKTKNPIRDGIQSALTALPASVLFGGAGEANVQLQINKAKTNITDTLVGAGMEREKAKVAADIIVKQHMIHGNENLFETQPKELKDAYENAVKFKQAQIEKMATDPEYKMDKKLNDTADSIIQAYQQYDNTVNGEENQQNAQVEQDTQDIANQALDAVPDENFDTAEQDWTQNVEPEYKKLQKKILKEQKKRELATKKDQFLNEPYTPESQLPTIEMGSKPRDKSGLPTIQMDQKTTAQKVAGDFTYHPVDDSTSKIDAYLEQQDKLISDFKEKHTKKKPVVKKKVSEKTKPVEKTTPKVESEKKVATEVQEPKVTATNPEEGTISKAASDINKELVARGFDSLSEDEQAKFTSISKQEQIDRVSELLAKDIEAAKRMALGLEDVPNNIKSQVLYNAVKNYALEQNDVQLIRDLAKSPIAEERALLAQSLGAAGFNNNEYDPVDIIQKINKGKAEDAKKELKGKTIKQATNEVVKDVKEKVDVKKPKRQDWESFINEITC